MDQKTGLSDEKEISPASIPTSDVYLELENKINKKSSYNNDYYCNIKAFKIKGENVEVHIEMRGNNSLGPIQNPESSQLKVGSQLLQFKDSHFTLADPTYGYDGYLVYNLKNELKGDYTFTFGFQFGGYTTVLLYTCY